MNAPLLLSLPDAAALLGVSLSTMKRLVASPRDGSSSRSVTVALGLDAAGVLHLVAAVRHLELNALTATGLAAAGLLQIERAPSAPAGRQGRTR